MCEWTFGHQMGLHIGVHIGHQCRCRLSVVPQQRIKPQSLTIWVSVTSAEYQNIVKTYKNIKL